MVSSAVSFVRSSRTLFDRCYKQLQINVGKVSDYNHVVATAFTTIFAVSQVEDVKHSYTSKSSFNCPLSIVVNANFIHECRE